ALAGASAYSRLFGITSGAVYVAKGALKQARGENDGTGGDIILARYYAENHAVEAPGLAKSIIAGGSWVSSDMGDALTG
ncbi:MAG: acyl-CoA dehydrogenase, partial [Alphaproteobacteria bacterium]